MSVQGVDGGVNRAFNDWFSSFMSSLRGVGRGSLCIDSLTSLLVLFLILFLIHVLASRSRGEGEDASFMSQLVISGLPCHCIGKFGTSNHGFLMSGLAPASIRSSSIPMSACFMHHIVGERLSIPLRELLIPAEISSIRVSLCLYSSE